MNEALGMDMLNMKENSKQPENEILNFQKGGNAKPFVSL